MESAAIYARVSTEEQQSGQTIQSQLEELRQTVKQNEYLAFGEYIDDGWSGALLERPALDRLRADLAAGRFKAVVIHSPDRLSRVGLHQWLLRDEFERSGAKVHFVKSPDTSEMSDEARVIDKAAWAMFSELERLKIKERTRRGRRYKVEFKKIIIGNIPPFGYRYTKRDPDTKQEGYYVVHDEEAQIVKKIFQLANQGMSARRIIKHLTDQGVPTRKGQPNWARSSIHKILTNRTYTGVTYFNKYESIEPAPSGSSQKYRKQSKTGRRLRPKQEWIPIPLPENLRLVDDATFEHVQRQLKVNKALSIRNSKHIYLLRGLLRCKQCGSAFVGCPMHGKFYYRCDNRNHTFPAPKQCNQNTIPENTIDEIVWKQIKAALLNPTLIFDQLEKAKARHQNVSRNGIKTIQTGLIRSKNEEKRLLEVYRTGIITADQLREQITLLNSKRERLENELLTLKETETNHITFDSIKIKLEEYCALISRSLDDFIPEEKQRVLRLLIEKIFIDENYLVIQGFLPVFQAVPISSSLHGQNPPRIVPIPSWNHVQKSTYTFEWVLPFPERKRRVYKKPVEGKNIPRQ